MGWIAVGKTRTERRASRCAGMSLLLLTGGSEGRQPGVCELTPVIGMGRIATYRSESLRWPQELSLCIGLSTGTPGS